MELGVTAVMLPEIGFEEQIALCVSLGIRYYQIRPRVIPPGQRGKPYSCWGNHSFDLTPEQLLSDGQEIASRLGRAGLAPRGTLPQISAADPDETILLHLRGAAAAGAGRMRLSPPPYPAGAFDYRAWLESAIDRYEHVVGRLARPLGIRLLVETHAGGAASSPGLAWNIVERFDPADMGVIFDLGNFAREGEVAPGLAVSVLCHWIDCVHVGGSRRAEAGDDELGCRRVVAETCPPQESDLHLPSWLSALRDAGLDPPLIIEDFSSKETGPAKLVRDAFLLRRLAQGLR